MITDFDQKGTSVMAKKEYDLRFKDRAGNPKPPRRVQVDLSDEEQLRAHLIDLAVEHDHRKRGRASEWIGEYSLEVCVPGHRRAELVFKAVR